MNIISYLRRPKVLKFDAHDDFDIVTKTDSDHASDHTRKSVSGCVIKVANCTVSATSKAQGVIADDPTEAEIISAHAGVKKGKEIENFVKSVK